MFTQLKLFGILCLFILTASFYSLAQEAKMDDKTYEERVNFALKQKKDVWGEELIDQGGATYENIKDYLRPLFYSTGNVNTELGVHNLLFALDNGAPPYIIPLADGSKLCANVYNSPRHVEFYVGTGDAEKYGSNLDNLEGPFLGGGYYPILQTGYSDKNGVKYSQESFASLVSGIDHLVAFVKLTVSESRLAELKIKTGESGLSYLRYTGSPVSSDGTLTYKSDKTIYLMWSPESEFPAGAKIDASVYAQAKAACKSYWDNKLEKGIQIKVPEEIVMNAQKNVLIQNLMMNWRYSLGAVVYHNSFYQPESSDAVTTLGMYGYLDECRDGLQDLLGKTKGGGAYTNWEIGEKLSHGAQYYFLSRDDAFVLKNASVYDSYRDQLKTQMENDPHGLPEKQTICGDQAFVSYCPSHQTVCWRGLRDLAQIYKLVGKEDSHKEYKEVSGKLKTALMKGIEESQTVLEDGSLFVPERILEGIKPFDPITETRPGSYWNLIMPYAFSSGLWDPNGEDMDRIVKFLHNHGATLLGMIRFNYYPIPIGEYRKDGLPGYYTTGYDNVYLPSYIELMADRDEAERLVLSFYGKLAHGMTRNTFVCGEGDNVGVHPDYYYRSCYGSPNSGNNVAFLKALRLMLVRDEFNTETGMPEGLYIAYATPRQWLEDGNEIAVENAPTCFGPLNYKISSQINTNIVSAHLETPERDKIATLKIKLRVPSEKKIVGVTVNGKNHSKYEAETGVIDLSGEKGVLEIMATYE